MKVSKSLKNRKIRNYKQFGGLCLKNCNMDQGPPFHPQWDSKYGDCHNLPTKPNNTYTWVQEGGIKNSRKNKKYQKGGLCLKSCNMEDGAPFHPQWDSKYGACHNVPTAGMNTYTWTQDGGSDIPNNNNSKNNSKKNNSKKNNSKKNNSKNKFNKLKNQFNKLPENLQNIIRRKLQ